MFAAYRSARQKSLTIQAIRECIHQHPQILNGGRQGTKVKVVSTSALSLLDKQTSLNMSVITETPAASHNYHHT